MTGPDGAGARPSASQQTAAEQTAAVLAAAVAEIGGHERPGQLELAEAVGNAFDTGVHLLAQAGTGTGKSLGYLAPTLVRLARETGKRVHVLHISTAQEMDFLKDHKDVASVEATPHHLTLEAPGCYERLGALAQMNPPVRDRAHKDGIWRGVHQGIVDVLGSDHCPVSLEVV